MWNSIPEYPSAATAAKSLQSCPTLWDPIDGSLPGSPIPGILQARTLEWVAISFSNAWKWKVKVKSLSHVRLFTTPWTAAYHAPPPIEFSRQEYWSGVPLPSPQKMSMKQYIHLLQLSQENIKTRGLNLTPSTSECTQQRSISSQCQKLEVQGSISAGLVSPWIIGGCLFAVSTHGLSSLHMSLWYLSVVF